MTDLAFERSPAGGSDAPEPDATTPAARSFDPDAHRSVVLPPPLGPVRRALADRRLMHYNRLAAVVVIVNLVVLANGVFRAGWFGADGSALTALAGMAVLNFTIAILIRQQHVINVLFRLATAAPTDWPLPLRRVLGKVYHFGGIHVGGAIMGTFWFAVSVGAAVHHRLAGLGGVSMAQLAVMAVVVVLLAAMIVTSLPRYRATAHDRFELVHRLGGWSVLVLFWVQALLVVVDNRDGTGPVAALLTAPSTWMLGLVTISVVLPWLRLKKVPIDIERPSDHVALVRFDHGVTPFAGSSTAISRSPLREWHSFANVPAPGRDGFRLTISRAGDWTGRFIDDQPGHVWVKGVPTAGVGNIDQLFRRVVWVATGSGIGPTLPHLLAGEVPAHLVWATRNPAVTYGQGLVGEILTAEPGAVIWNTDTQGKPDMVRLAYAEVARTGAEAVICISNKKLTWQVVEGLERLGIPAYGAIWDS